MSLRKVFLRKRVSIVSSDHESPRGFTMVELLVVISIIGILSGLLFAVIRPGNMRANARDAQRLSDLRVIQGALELYFADHRQYPCSGSVCASSNWIRIDGSSDRLSQALTLGGYLSEMRVDPTNNGTQSSPCYANSPNAYRYNYYSRGSSYYITAILEDANNNSGSICGSTIPVPTGAFTGSCNFADSANSWYNNCTVVRNP